MILTYESVGYFPQTPEKFIVQLNTGGSSGWQNFIESYLEFASSEEAHKWMRDRASRNPGTRYRVVRL